MNLFFTVSFFFHKHIRLHFNSHKTSAPQISLFFVFFLEFYLLNKFLLFMYFYFEYQVHIKKKQHSDFFTGHYFF